MPAHLTLFHHLPPSVEGEVGRRLAAYAATPAPTAAIAGMIDLGGGTALRVESEGLEDIRYDLALALRGLLTPQDMAPWRPHVTIQNKVEPKEAKALPGAAARGVRAPAAGDQGPGAVALSGRPVGAGEAVRVQRIASP